MIYTEIFYSVFATHVIGLAMQQTPQNQDTLRFAVRSTERSRSSVLQT